jgi:thiamine-phosphate pyrophosphorylase
MQPRPAHSTDWFARRTLTRVQRRPKNPFRLYLITDRKLAAAHGGLPAVVETVLSAASAIAGPGAVALQLREKDLDARALYELARELRPRCSRFGAPLLINDRIDVAMAMDADGVHLPSNSFAVPDARALLGPSRLIGISTHEATEVAAAARAGADFAVFGPVYDPVSKAAYGPARGPESLTAACRVAAGMPIYALGGITPARVHELGAMMALQEHLRPTGVAVIGAVFAADEPTMATRELIRTLMGCFPSV